MPAKSRRCLFLYFLLLHLAFAAVWVIRSSLARQTAADTRALIAKVLSSDDNAVSSLLDKGANPNTIAQSFTSDPSNIPRPPLIHAVQSGNEKIVKALLNYGADPNVRDSSGTTMLGNAVSWNRTAIVNRPLA